MGRKTWGSLTEESLIRSAAAFAFVRAYKASDMKAKGVRVAHGLFSKLATEMTVLSCCDPLRFYPAVTGLCLGQFHWGCLLWPINPFFGELNDAEWWTLDFSQISGEACWVHIVNPQHWKVWSFENCQFGEDLILMRFRDSTTLLQHFFGQVSKHNLLTKFDLINLGECLGALDSDIEVLNKMPRLDLIDALLDIICDGDIGWTEPIKQAMRKPKATEASAADELQLNSWHKELGTVLDEVVLSEMPLEERQDFKEIQEAVQQRAISAGGWAVVAQKGKGKGKGKKSSAKAKAKAAAKNRGRLRGKGGGRGVGRSGRGGGRAGGRAGGRRLKRSATSPPEVEPLMAPLKEEPEDRSLILIHSFVHGPVFQFQNVFTSTSGINLCQHTRTSSSFSCPTCANFIESLSFLI